MSYDLAGMFGIACAALGILSPLSISMRVLALAVSASSESHGCVRWEQA